MSRATLKPIVSNLRESIIKGISGKLEKYGLNENGIIDIEKPLSEYDENIKNSLIALFAAEKIDSKEKYIQYIHNTSRTFLHILICFKLMEKRGIMSSLLKRVINTDIYGEIIPDFVKVNHLAFDEFISQYSDEISIFKERAGSEENDEYYQFFFLMEKLTNEMAQEVPLLFKDYEHSLIHPDFADLKTILYEVSQINEDEYFEDDFLGWIYQYWVDTEPKEVKKANAEKDISYSNNIYSQVLNILGNEQTEYGEFYTPRWVVKYVVDNSISNYRKEKDLPIEDIKILDPACGAGNYLVYAFDALMSIYNEEHLEWSVERKIETILEKNIFGADIQREPLQITALNLWIKAKSLATSSDVKRLNLFNLNVLMANSLYPWEREEEYYQITIWDTPDTIKEKRYSYEDIGKLISTRRKESHNNAIRFFKNKFDVIIMNPPFVDARKMNSETSQMIKEYYPNNARNTFGAFIERSINLLDKEGVLGFICSDTFLTLGSFEYIRDLLLKKKIIDAYLLGEGIFDGPTVNSTILIISMKSGKNNEIKVHKKDNQTPIKTIMQKDLNLIKGHPFIFDISTNMRKILSQKTIGDYTNIFEVRKGIVTANNDKYLKYYWEVPEEKIGTDFITYNRRHNEFLSDTIYVMDWRKESQPEILKSPSARCAYMIDNFHGDVNQSSFKKGVAFSLNGKFRCCLLENDMAFDVDTPAVLMEDVKYRKYILAYLKSDWIQYLVRVINNSVSTTPGDVRKMPIIFPNDDILNQINENVDGMLDIAEKAYALNLISHYYKASPIQYGFNRGAKSIKEAYELYSSYVCTLNLDYQVLLDETNELINNLYGLDEYDKKIINESIDRDNELVKIISVEEALLVWLQEIYVYIGNHNKTGLFLVNQVKNIITQYIETNYGFELYEELEKEIGDVESVIQNGIKVSGKTLKFYGEGVKDISNPFICCKKLGGNGKTSEIVLWITTNYKMEFDEDRKYALQNEIRRLTDEIYLLKLQRVKERMQDVDLPTNIKKQLEKELKIYEECVKTLENWKVVD